MKYIQTFLLSVLFITAAAQQGNVTGSVVAKQNGVLSPLQGATVNTNQATTTTDDNGKFSIKAKDKEILTFSHVGMKTVTLTVTNSTFDQPVTITMEYEQNNLSEVVVTGYQTQKKADLTGAVSVIKTSDIKDIPVGNAMKAVQGRMPGVLVTTDGTPNGTATVRIRGIGTLNNNDPLYIIDGIPTKRGLEQINPADIETFQVLKDASSASIYGSRAANGVIIITTKQGKKGASQINFSASVSLQDYTSKIHVLNSEERGRAYWQAAINDGINPNAASGTYQYQWDTINGILTLNNIIIPEYLDAAKTMKSANTNWYDETSQTSIVQSYDLSVSNANDKGRSFFGLGYYDNKGIVKGTFAKRFAARMNTEYRFFNNKLAVGENFSANYILRDRIPTTGGDGVEFNSLYVQPLVPVHTVNGGWGGPGPGMTDKQNPVRQIEDNRQNKNYYVRLFGNAYIDLEVIPRLHLRSSYGIDYFTSYQRTLRKSYVSGSLSDPSNQVANDQSYDGSLTWQNTATYDFKINKNSFEVLGGVEKIRYNTQSFSASRQGLALENIDYAYLDAGSTNIQNNGSGTVYTLQSFFGKVNYIFDNKYLASVTVRRDGSSRFGNENQYGTFPAFSLGWRLSQEQFFKNTLPFFSDFKLRYGWGRNGNQEIANNATYTLYQSIYGTDRTWDPDKGTAYDIAGANSGTLPSGFVITQHGNESLKWETTTQSNFGADFGLFDNKLTGSVDYFIKKTTGILIVPPSLAVVGGGTPAWVNGASMQNKGVEAIISYSTKIKDDIDLTLSGNFATYRNKVTSLPENSLSAYAGNGTDKTILGRSINSYFGYIADGLFTSQDQVDKSPAQPGKGLGRIKYKNLNDDDVINDKDRDYMGTSDPDFTYGLNIALNYKSFDFSIFFQGVSGIDANNDFKRLTDFSSINSGTNWGKRTLSAWSPQNPNSSIPALTLIDQNTESRFSTYFIESGSYLKLRNLQIGYTFKNLLTKFNMKSARLYVQGSNLLTIKSKSFTGPDPEMPSYSYPIPAIYTIGFNVAF